MQGVQLLTYSTRNLLNYSTTQLLTGGRGDTPHARASACILCAHDMVHGCEVDLGHWQPRQLRAGRGY
eukprot:4759858-Pleurochrysis_carterae.AAC.2